MDKAYFETKKLQHEKYWDDEQSLAKLALIQKAKKA